MAVPEGGTYYVEHVTADVEGTRAALERVHGWRFGAPDPDLGGSRVAKLPDGSFCGIRAPLSGAEAPVTRRYVRVASVKRAIAAAGRAGAHLALPSMGLGRHGTIGIFILHGVEHGVWELPRKAPARTGRKRAARKAASTRSAR